MSGKKFAYKALSAGGEIKTGSYSGQNERQVVAWLQRQGLTPLRVVPVSDDAKMPRAVRSTSVFHQLVSRVPHSAAFWPGLLAELRSLPSRFSNRKDIITFTEDLAVLLQAGIPLTRSLLIIAELVDKASFKEVITGVYESVKEGSSLWQALKDYPAVFPPILWNMVKAGESGGVLGLVLLKVAEYLAGVRELREFLLTAMIYPVILTLTAAVSIFVLLTFVLPKFAVIFTDMGVALPLATRLMLALGDFLRAYYWLLAGMIVASILGWRFYRKTPQGRKRWDGFKLRLPLLGPIFNKIEVSRFARTLGTLLASGVPIMEALQIVRGVVLNRLMHDGLGDVYRDLKQGGSHSQALAATGLFPNLAIHMIGVGEETGAMDTMLGKIADIYDRELKSGVKSFTAMFEPLIILFMGLVIGAMVVSMLMAIFSVNELGF